MTGVLIKRGNLDTEADTHREKTMRRDTGKRQPSTSQGERLGTDPSLTASERTNPAHTLTSDF